jgi:hypothetical protein
MGKPSGSNIIAKSQSPSEEIAKAFAAGVVRKSCPLYPQKRTSFTAAGMSALCHKRTSTGRNPMPALHHAKDNKNDAALTQP